ncbi:MAG: isoprenyl transferase [Gammaproteobacteria bacterium]|uniref:isoprenyl transferase n=1 Tax=Limnobacter sp. TaxID=2003368 RepID=UPI001D227EF2|nr:isoprenyl transferase [Limnobacter sp.]MBU0783233.1 isoprenyl transferase [Gammaproteobacteria bacterium]MBU0850452.1 isoprenyl transferase [Gammaproteobacteria bacterium]MBU1268285.1 isoprenyl transferase [Gammaproteobacteria bacterium]MBU1528867.1 isoprenyl transferase [Gammaproteobacteria bacterium]MBU1780464.1 isoprenyl transferase [Gammaproteobacteria bacterium]
MAIFTSSTLDVPNTSSIPRHIAIVMDGNGRWAKNRLMPRVAGHKRGVDAVKRTVQACCELGVEHLTLFAFSSENWRRPPEEVSVLMRLFIRVLRKDVEAMHRENICLRIVGDTTAFEPELQAAIASAQELTKNNTRLYLNIAANYGGRWDILQATKNMLKSRPDLADNPELITEASLSQHLCLQGSPEPDLFIRTGGEQRVSNFLLWQLAYTEFYFTDKFWPDFGKPMLLEAIDSYNNRERRFGRTSEQIQPQLVNVLQSAQ